MPSDCSQNLGDPRIHRKRSSFEMFSKPESSFCQKCEVFGHFSLQSSRNYQKLPSDCSQNLRDSRVHRKSWFFEGFSKSNLNKEFGKHNPESSFCQKSEVLGRFSLLSPRMCHLIAPQNCGTPGFAEKTFFEKLTGNFSKD